MLQKMTFLGCRKNASRKLPQNGIVVEYIAPSSCHELFSVREYPSTGSFTYSLVSMASVITDEDSLILPLSNRSSLV